MVYRIVLCFLTMVLFHILRTHGGQPAPLGVSPQAALGPGAPFALLFPDLGVCRAVSRSSLQAAIVLQFFFFFFESVLTEAQPMFLLAQLWPIVAVLLELSENGSSLTWGSF